MQLFYLKPWKGTPRRRKLFLNQEIFHITKGSDFWLMILYQVPVLHLLKWAEEWMQTSSLSWQWRSRQVGVSSQLWHQTVMAHLGLLEFYGHHPKQDWPWKRQKWISMRGHVWSVWIKMWKSGMISSIIMEIKTTDVRPDFKIANETKWGLAWKHTMICKNCSLKSYEY